MRTVAVVTTARSDFGIYLPVLRRIVADRKLRLHLIVSGTHLVVEFGATINEIRASGFQVDDTVEMLLASDSPEAIAKSMGLGTIGFAQVFARLKPDLLLLLGDRFEMHAAAVAALPFRIPTAHIHGGELTEGAIDDSLRHSITKLSHLHFPSTVQYGRRIEQLGEEAWRITVAGAPSLDNLAQVSLLTRTELTERYGFQLPEQFMVVTFHPATHESSRPEEQLQELLYALEEMQTPVLFTMANADTGGRVINELIKAFTDTKPWAMSAKNLGTQGYFSVLALASAMIGNSSSGIIEAASFRLPVVNIGIRQKGRVCGRNVIHCGNGRHEIVTAIRGALSPEFRTSLAELTNPYGQGNASERIVEKLASVELNECLLIKKFHDLPFGPQ